MERMCNFEGCDRKHYGKGLCSAHWQQKHRFGKELTPIRERLSVDRCEFRDCNRKPTRKNLCDGHYRQLQRGEELRTLLQEEPFMTRLKRLITIDEVTGCWNTKAYRQKMTWRGTADCVYRHVYREMVGPLPRGSRADRGEAVDHLCLNPYCANPAHLQKVSNRENNKRMHVHTALRARIARLESQIRELGQEPVN